MVILTKFHECRGNFIEFFICGQVLNKFHFSCFTLYKQKQNFGLIVTPGGRFMYWIKLLFLLSIGTRTRELGKKWINPSMIVIGPAKLEHLPWLKETIMNSESLRLTRPVLQSHQNLPRPLGPGFDSWSPKLIDQLCKRRYCMLINCWELMPITVENPSLTSPGWIHMEMSWRKAIGKPVF